ncbi:MAG TPA: hypothetical protein VGM19_06205 [Armatimonadota bacterium]|jgi:hypothetical protein
MLRPLRSICWCLLALGLLAAALPALAADYEDIFLASHAVARLYDPGKFATVAERAAKVEAALVEVLSTQDTMHPKVVSKQEAGMWVVYAGTIRVLSVLPKDATGAGVNSKTVAENWAKELIVWLPRATPPSRMGVKPVTGAAAPKPPTGVSARPAVPALPATRPAAVATTAPTALPPLTRSAALLLLLDSFNSVRSMPDDEYLSRRDKLAGDLLARMQSFLAGAPLTATPLPATATPVVTPPVETTPAVTPPVETPAVTPPVETPAATTPVTPLPPTIALPAGLDKLSAHDRVIKKFELAAKPYQELRATNPGLYTQVGGLLAEARASKAAFRWDEADGFLDGALSLMGFQVPGR